jgi:hypothetical protein
LYELDTEAEATAVASEGSAEPAAAEAAPPAPEPAEKAAPASAAPVAAKKAPTTRVPSIQFLGKDGWAQKLSGADAAVVYLPKNYGRPVFSEADMDALVTGGANIAPQVKDYSHGALFG